ncbi:MAG: S46 family peptidase [Bacteroidales bacterium]|nr:S46 family peptidase [Bacteroidales bacterium]
MKKLLYILISFLLLAAPKAKADEGMWIPLLIDRLNYVDMQEMGLNLTPEEIYSINNSSLKDAIVIFGGGCTGEIISNEGLLLTNHHCGYGIIQSHSTVEHDYLSDGFWSTSREEELANPGLSVRFLQRIEDVSERVLSELNDDMTEEERTEKVNEISSKIEAKAKEDTHYTASVRSFFRGNEYYLFVYEIFRDVRLVGAPPSSIGKFGADTDNWMWPRHTGDFSLFRVYSAPDGSPADYNEENIPLKPKHFLPVSVKGVERGDFAMIMGYPGSTDRYLTSYGVKLAVEESNMTIVKIREEKLAIMRQGMDADDEVRIKYASKYAGTANYWKYFIGQTKGLKRLKVYDKKVKLEDRFTKWVNSSPERKAKYGEALADIEKAYDILKEYNLSRWYYREAISRGSEILGFSARFGTLYKLLDEDAEQEKIDKAIERLKSTTERHFKNYNTSIDRNMLASMMNMYYMNVPPEQQSEMLIKLAQKNDGDFSGWAAEVFEKSIFSSPEKAYEFLENPKAKKIAKDPAYEVMKAFSDKYSELSSRMDEADAYLSRGNRLFIAGLREMDPDKVFYPDANFTMRLTYGSVLDYYPADAIRYEYYTTLDGVMEKEDPDNWEFVVPDKLKELYKNKDYGIYSEGDIMPVCFLTNHDITGGNSGSPVINGNGELIGLAFDGNWEAMSGDIAFEPALQRTINVDIRYVLFIIDKFAGAQNIIDELTIVK